MSAIKDHVTMKGTKLSISMKHFESAFDKVKRKSPQIRA
jgi:hypothetical protein